MTRLDGEVSPTLKAVALALIVIDVVLSLRSAYRGTRAVLRVARTAR